MAFEARENEFFLSHLITATFSNGECGETLPETNALGSGTIPLILTSKLVTAVLKASSFSTFVDQALAELPPLKCWVMAGP